MIKKHDLIVQTARLNKLTRTTEATAYGIDWANGGVRLVQADGPGLREISPRLSRRSLHQWTGTFIQGIHQGLSLAAKIAKEPGGPGTAHHALADALVGSGTRWTPAGALALARHLEPLMKLTPTADVLAGIQRDWREVARLQDAFVGDLASPGHDAQLLIRQALAHCKLAWDDYLTDDGINHCLEVYLKAKGVPLLAHPGGFVLPSEITTDILLNHNPRH